jgi:hypothetical protein
MQGTPQFPVPPGTPGTQNTQNTTKRFVSFTPGSSYHSGKRSVVTAGATPGGSASTVIVSTTTSSAPPGSGSGSGSGSISGALGTNTFSAVIRQIENPRINAQSGTGIGQGAGAAATSLANDQTFVDDAAERVAAFNMKKQELDATPYWRWLTHVAGAIGGQSAYMFLSDDAKKIFTANDHARLAHLVAFVSTPELHLSSGSGPGLGMGYIHGPGVFMAGHAANPCPLKANIVMQTRMAYMDMQRSLANRKLSVPELVALVNMQQGDMSVAFASLVAHKLRFSEANEQNESKLDATMQRAAALVAQDIQTLVALARDAEGISDRTQYYAHGAVPPPHVYDRLAYLFN